MKRSQQLMRDAVRSKPSRRRLYCTEYDVEVVNGEVKSTFLKKWQENGYLPNETGVAWCILRPDGWQMWAVMLKSNQIKDRAKLKRFR